MRRKERSVRISTARMEQIRGAARRVFAARGYHGTTTDEIAREAGVSPGLIFHYFPSKKHLLIEVVRELAVGSLARSLQPLSGETVDEQLLRLLREHGAFLSQHLDLLQVVFAEARFEEEVRSLIVEKLLAEGAGVLEGFFRRHVAAGSLRADLDVPLAAHTLIGLLISFVVLRDALRDPVLRAGDPEVTYRHLVRLFLDGIREAGPGRD